MSERFRFIEGAAQEIEEASDWYEHRSELAQEAFLQEIDHALHAILDGPQRWPLHLKGTRRYVCSNFPYGVIYLVEDDVVVVVAVAHEKRRPGYWRKRLQ